MIVPIHAGAAATQREHFATAFHALEAEVCDLTRMPRLAELQLYEAVGKLSFVGGEYTEPPKAEATDLAVFAVSQMADMAKRFQELYFRLHNEAATAGVVALAA
ncbi:MAG: hypothetical protein QOJ15_1333 [Bradyrhizobium sp.]|jgi:hypothetical protein|nr:hypothetical protein [Bradyrhizobium sp.]